MLIRDLHNFLQVHNTRKLDNYDNQKHIRISYNISSKIYIVTCKKKTDLHSYYFLVLKLKIVRSTNQ